MEAMGMKIAIPITNGKLAMHFGHCEAFAMVEVDDETKQITTTSMLEAPPHQPGLLPRWLGEHGATVIIAGGMGQRAQDLFTQQNIEVVVGATPGSPEEIANAYLNGTLVAGPNICDH
jgi:predicted Fe-Mo cluster-binding NifX family protein